ncbi:phosphoserine aminotransferase [Physcia stellaris]|nr:phosphoserine aminotransferase [Physcia stellaris]
MDPTILNPTTLFARPDHHISRSPSHSPTRQRQLIKHELDPLLANLSPTSTLEALQSTDTVSADAGTHKRALLDSVAIVSTSDRAWGIKAALAGKKVKEWYEEVAAWPWPSALDGSANGFEPFSARRSLSGVGFSINGESGGIKEEEMEFWGHLPAHLVHECEDRIESIRDDMDALELEDLKEHVRTSHNLSGRKRSLYGQSQSDDHTTHGHMDDFTAIITATIMQTLPHISRLHSLLGIWSARLSVLRQVPGFLDCMEKAQTAIKAAWNVVRPLNPQALEQTTGTDRNTFSTIQGVLAKQITELGQRLDCMLDALEGREDTLPGYWIENMEDLEAEFGSWVVETERQVLQDELKVARSRNKAESALTLKNRLPGPHAVASSHQTPAMHPYAKSGLDGHLGDQNRSDNGTNLANPIGEPQVGDGILDAPSTYLDQSLEADISGKLRSDHSTSLQAEQDGPLNLSAGSKRLPASEPTSLSHHDASSNMSSSEPLLERAPVEIRYNGSFDPFTPERSEDNVSNADRGVAPRGRSVSKPTPLKLKHPRNSMVSNAASEFSSDVSFPGSSTSDYFSDMSSPEIQQASRAEYFGAPIEITTPNFSYRDPMDTVSRQSSQRTERASRSMSMDFSSGDFTSPVAQRSRASSFIPNSNLSEIGGLANGNTGHQRARSASMQAFSVIPHNQGNKVTARRSSHSTTSTAPAIVPDTEALAFISLDPHGSDPESDHSDRTGATVQAMSLYDSEVTGSDIPPISSENQTECLAPRLSQPEVPNLPNGAADPSPVPTKSRNRFETVTDIARGSTPVKIRQRRRSDTSPHKPPARILSPPRNDAEQLEARISSILTTIPAHIRLTSGPELEAPEVKLATPDPRTPLPRSKTAPRLSRAQTTTPSPLPQMTLAPAQPSNGRSRPQGGDPEIKLYHLHQSGKEAPIKLFVRLVGEAGERVMVRIGGGWADLGEYLKEYASHHGKRSVSDSRFAIQELSSTPINGSPAAGGASLPGSRPESSYGSGPVTPDSGVFKQLESTPLSNTSLRPDSAHSWKEEESPLGGAGPKTKKVDVSPTKQAWVDGMLEQARHAAIEKRVISEILAKWVPPATTNTNKPKRDHSSPSRRSHQTRLRSPIALPPPNPSRQTPSRPQPNKWPTSPLRTPQTPGDRLASYFENFFRGTIGIATFGASITFSKITDAPPSPRRLPSRIQYLIAISWLFFVLTLATTSFAASALSLYRPQAVSAFNGDLNGDGVIGKGEGERLRRRVLWFATLVAGGLFALLVVAFVALGLVVVAFVGAVGWVAVGFTVMFAVAGCGVLVWQSPVRWPPLWMGALKGKRTAGVGEKEGGQGDLVDVPRVRGGEDEGWGGWGLW